MSPQQDTLCPGARDVWSKIGRCRGGLDFFRPWIIHTLPSAGKDLTGGPGPWARVPGFLCSQQRPENRPGHDRHVRPQRPKSVRSHRPPGGLSGPNCPVPKPAWTRGLRRQAGVALCFHSSTHYPWFGANQLRPLGLTLLPCSHPLWPSLVAGPREAPFSQTP